MKKLITFIGLLIGSQAFSQGQALGEIVGTVVDAKDKLGIPNAIAWIDDDGKKYHAVTDENGKFRISAIPAGEYVVMITDQMDTITTNSVSVPMDGFGNLGTVIFAKPTFLDVATIIHSKTHDELVLALNSTPVYTLTAKDIQHLSVKFDVKAMISMMSSDVKMDENGDLSFRGSRTGEMIYYLDGVKLNETQNTPSCSINNMIVYTGGIPAKYGDTLGGVVVVETKSYFDLLREYTIQQRKGN
jgi:hypothetical protein